MVAAAPDLGVPRGLERGLIWTIAVSALVHGAAVALLVVLPKRSLSVPPRMESYTVDLIAPDVLGGTNLVRGGGRKPAPVPVPVAPVPLAEAPPRQPDPGPVPRRIAEAPKPPPVEKPAPARSEEKAVAPKPLPAREAEQKAVPQKVAEPPKAIVPKAEPKTIPKTDSAIAAPKSGAKVSTKSETAAKPLAKADVKPPVPPAAQRAAAVDKSSASNPPPAAAEEKPAAAAAPAAKPAPVVEPRDQAIAAAIQRRAQQVKTTDATKPTETDQRIADAVQRRAAQVEKGGGSASGSVGGPISSGPGSGTGGTPTDLQYILYHGRMIERIKAAWAWAGADKSLRAVVQFNVSPDGEVQNVRVIESSGDPQYDISAARAVRAVNPLEPVPEKYREAFATQEITFQASDLES